MSFNCPKCTWMGDVPRTEPSTINIKAVCPECNAYIKFLSPEWTPPTTTTNNVSNRPEQSTLGLVVASDHQHFVLTGLINDVHEVLAVLEERLTDKEIHARFPNHTRFNCDQVIS